MSKFLDEVEKKKMRENRKAKEEEERQKRQEVLEGKLEESIFERQQAATAMFTNATFALSLDAVLMDSLVQAEISNSILNVEHENSLLNVLNTSIRALEFEDLGIDPEARALVVGKLLDEQNAIERCQRHAYAALFRRYGYPTKEFRNMMVGYLVNRDGLAVDADDNLLGEESPGQYYLDGELDKLEPAPEYVEIFTENDKVICRIFRNNEVAIKEALANFDIPKGDKINELYRSLAMAEEHLLYRLDSLIKKSISSYKRY